MRIGKDLSHLVYILFWYSMNLRYATVWVRFISSSLYFVLVFDEYISPILYFVLVFDESALRYDFHYVPIWVRFGRSHSSPSRITNKKATNKKATNKKATNKKATNKEQRTGLLSILNLSDLHPPSNLYFCDQIKTGALHSFTC